MKGRDANSPWRRVAAPSWIGPAGRRLRQGEALRDPRHAPRRLRRTPQGGARRVGRGQGRGGARALQHVVRDGRRRRKRAESVLSLREGRRGLGPELLAPRHHVPRRDHVRSPRGYSFQRTISSGGLAGRSTRRPRRRRDLSTDDPRGSRDAATTTRPRTIHAAAAVSPRPTEDPGTSTSSTARASTRTASATGPSPPGARPTAHGSRR